MLNKPKITIERARELTHRLKVAQGAFNAALGDAEKEGLTVTPRIDETFTAVSAHRYLECPVTVDPEQLT